MLSVSLLSSLSPPPPFSSSHGITWRLPPYSLPAQQCRQRHSRDACRASTCPSNHRRYKRARGWRRGGQPQAANGGGSDHGRRTRRCRPPRPSLHSRHLLPPPSLSLLFCCWGATRQCAPWQGKKAVPQPRPWQVPSRLSLPLPRRLWRRHRVIAAVATGGVDNPSSSSCCQPKDPTAAAAVAAPAWWGGRRAQKLWVDKIRHCRRRSSTLLTLYRSCFPSGGTTCPSSL